VKDGKTARRQAGKWAAAATAALSFGAPLAAQDVGLAIGAVPASATVQDLAGQAVDLAATFVGKQPVVVEFWATWCPICEALLPRMRAAQQRYGRQVEFVVVGVGVNQSRASMQRHLDRHPMPFRFFFDNAGAAVRAFQAPTTSYIVALDARGRVVYTGVGEDQDVAAAARRAAGIR
jgi:thiol-disulfide isomerase/thioredoxin